jgi:putative ABC transport system permease protein
VNWSVKNPQVTVIGVARDIRHQQLASTDLDVYRPFRQLWAGGSWFALRTAGIDPMTLAQAATRIVTETDGNQSFFDVRRMDERIRSGIWQQQTAGALFTLFAALALALASIGLYGVLSYLVTQQWREIGVRIALGASPGEVQRMVIGRGATLAAVGIVLGLALAGAAARALAPILFEVPGLDIWSFLGVPLALFVVALVACYLPARRATRVDPLVALRAD